MIVICFLIFLLQCEFWARQKNKLDKHVQRVHLRQKNFLCEKCDFRGFIQAELDVHVREVCIVLYVKLIDNFGFYPGDVRYTEFLNCQHLNLTPAA